MPSRRLPIESVRSTLIHEALAYWRSIRGGKALPARSDLDPTKIPRLLPYLYLNEIHRDPLRVRYRVVGTRICQIEGREKTGTWMHEEVPQDDYEAWLADYRHVMDTRQPLFGHDDLDHLGRSYVSFEWAVFPLSSDGRMVDMTFELEVYDNERELLMQPSSLGLTTETPAHPTALRTDREGGAQGWGVDQASFTDQLVLDSLETNKIV